MNSSSFADGKTSSDDVRSTPSSTSDSCRQTVQVNVTDFGLARHFADSESLSLTRSGIVLGTPRYMAPEQCSGRGQICPQTDVYAMGATLFQLLTGRPPFLGEDTWELIGQHCNEPPPLASQFQPNVSDAVVQIVDKALAKTPADRYANAGAMLRDLERVQRGEPTTIDQHPKIPECDPKRVLKYDFVWQLEAPPAALWPHVSNTERLNHAVGLRAAEFTSEPGVAVPDSPVPDTSDPESDEPHAADAANAVRQFGKIEIAGMQLEWEEHPFEWIEGRRLSVLREFKEGPFKWFVNVVELEPRTDGGTELKHSIRIEPRSLLGRTVAAVELGVKARRSLARVYQRIDTAVTDKLGDGADPFTKPIKLSAARRRRVEMFKDRLIQRDMNPEIAEPLCDLIAHGPSQELARIRPLVLARQFGCDADEVVATCLHAAREGLLVLLGDILCPVCRIPADVLETLRMLRDHGHCPACNLDFELDFANSIELIFRASPQIRDVDTGTYCIGGPAHSPHVVLQSRLAAGERIEVELALREGVYQLRGPQLPRCVDFEVRPWGQASQWDVRLGAAAMQWVPCLKSGRQLLTLSNEYGLDVLVRMERTAPHRDALTAAKACSLAVFRQWFPDEMLSPGQLISVAAITLLVTDLEHSKDLYRKLGDAKAFSQVHTYLRLTSQSIEQHGGAIVKTVDEAVLTVFEDPRDAVSAALALPQVLANDEATRDLPLRIAVHHGPALVATVNDQLDYFGETVKTVWELLAQARGAEWVTTSSVASDPAVAELLNDRQLQCDLPDQHQAVVHRFKKREPPEPPLIGAWGFTQTQGW